MHSRAARYVLVPAMLSLAGASCTGATNTPRTPEARGLALSDFEPRSKLHARVTRVERARFPAIDVHQHVNDAVFGQHIPMERLVEIMDRTNVEALVILTGKWGDELERVVKETSGRYPGRFLVFTQIDWSLLDRPDFSEQAVQRLSDAVRRGARGLKSLKELGLGVREPGGKLLAVDDPRLDPIWEACGRLGLPVSIHVGDPEAFFDPVDANNERYEELRAHPDWSFHDPKYPRLEELVAAQERVFSRHPKTTFIALHMGNWPENLDWVSGMLERNPNVHVELGARQAELGRQPRRTRAFFLKFSDRILFGTDFLPSEPMYANWFRWLETDDESFDYWDAPAQGRWKIYGLALPDDVLRRVYSENAIRLFGPLGRTKRP